MEQAEQPVGPPVRVDPVETALSMAVSAVSQASPFVMRYLPQLPHARRTIRVPSAADGDADIAWGEQSAGGAQRFG